MKATIALLIAAVSATTDDAAADTTAKTGAAVGEACFDGKADSGCAEGLRCHLGVAVTAGAAATVALTKEKCTTDGLGDLGFVKTTPSCKFVAKAAADFKAGTATPVCTATLRTT